MAMVTPNSDEFWPGAVVPLSMATIEATSGVSDRRRADADLLGDGEQPVDVDRRRRAARARSALSAASIDGDAGLVVEMARDDEAVVEEFRLRIDGDDVADVDAERERLRAVRRAGVDAQLDMLPADGLRVDLLVEGVARGLQRQDRAAIGALLGEERHARALGEARRPVADRHQLEPAVLLDQLHLRAERVEMGDDGARGRAPAALADGADRAAPRQLGRQAEPLQLLGAVAHDLVGVAGGAGDREQLWQLLGEIVDRRSVKPHPRSQLSSVRLRADLAAATAETAGRRSAPPSAAARGWPGPAARWPR